MDLFAYAQIENIEEIAKENGIECPRLRGIQTHVGGISY